MTGPKIPTKDLRVSFLTTGFLKSFQPTSPTRFPHHHGAPEVSRVSSMVGNHPHQKAVSLSTGGSSPWCWCGCVKRQSPLFRFFLGGIQNTKVKGTVLKGNVIFQPSIFRKKMLVFWGVLGCPAGTDRNDPKFVSWVVSPTNGERRIQPTLHRGKNNLLILSTSRTSDGVDSYFNNLFNPRLADTKLVRYFPGPQKDTKQTESHTSGGMTGRLGICKII